jgi:hypothetical protein
MGKVIGQVNYFPFGFAGAGLAAGLPAGFGAGFAISITLL